jgi:hypothetical protein
MSPTLEMMKGQLSLFQSGAIGIDEMWDRIDQRMDRASQGEEPDPYEDDKAERRVLPAHV